MTEYLLKIKNGFDQTLSRAHLDKHGTWYKHWWKPFQEVSGGVTAEERIDLSGYSILKRK